MFFELLPITQPSQGVPTTAKQISIYSGDMYAQLNEDIDLLYLGDQMVKLRTASKSVKLVSIKTDGTTESTLSIASPPANYEETFRIRQIFYISPNTAYIMFDWATSATARSTIQMYAISVQPVDGVLYGANVSVGTGSSATLSTDSFILPSMYDDKDIIIVYKDTTISTGVVSNNTAYMAYYAEPNHVLTSYTAKDGGGTSYRVSMMSCGGANGYSAIRHNIHSRGGMFYRNNSNVLYLSIYYRLTYYKSVAALTTICPNFSTYTTFNGVNFNIINHFVLGLTNSRYLTTLQFIYDGTNEICDIVIYLWVVDFRGTGILKPLLAYSPTSDNMYATSIMPLLANDYGELNVENYYMLSFVDDTLLLWDSVANIYYEIHIYADDSSQTVIDLISSGNDAVNIYDGMYSQIRPSMVGRGSSPFNCVFINNE